jgi:hypothetical protein
LGQYHAPLLHLDLVAEAHHREEHGAMGLRGGVVETQVFREEVQLLVMERPVGMEHVEIEQGAIFAKIGPDDHADRCV